MDYWIGRCDRLLNQSSREPSASRVPLSPCPGGGARSDCFDKKIGNVVCPSR